MWLKLNYICIRLLAAIAAASFIVAIGQNIWKARQSNHYFDVHAGAAAVVTAAAAVATAAAVAAAAAAHTRNNSIYLKINYCLCMLHNT